MENKIEVGEYIRTEKGFIGKVNNSIYSYLLECEEGEVFEKEDIRKHSKNIIDLIEEGDILKVREGNIIFWLGIEKGDTQFNHRELMYSIKNKEVELLSIVTKEQFKSVEYDV